MNPEYVLLGGYFWRRWSKRVVLWYAHTGVTRKLRHAVGMVDRVCTVSADSFGIRTPKLATLGHGIDTRLFNPTLHLESARTRFITIGRIAESKHLLEMFEMLDTLDAYGEKFIFTIVGIPTTHAEVMYAARLYDEVKVKPYAGNVRFLGAVPHDKLPPLLHVHDVALNFATTGNMDKAGLEALAAGIPLFSTNPAFEALLSPFGLYAQSVVGEKAATTLVKFLNRADKSAVVSTLRNKVVAEHSLKNLVPNILHTLS